MVICIYKIIERVVYMALKEGNSQVYFALPDEIIKKLDEQAGIEYLSRSQLCKKIIIEYVKKVVDKS